MQINQTTSVDSLITQSIQDQSIVVFSAPRDEYEAIITKAANKMVRLKDVLRLVANHAWRDVPSRN
ncbi:hypothetical protein [Rhodopirellula europaea]|uniref:hypothetical protein n=1 Tax=Rhodopirellula europaea TaxID=1263866 RepID=UPI003D2661BB